MFSKKVAVLTLAGVSIAIVLAATFSPQPSSWISSVLELIFESSNVFFSGVGRVLPGFNGILFGRQSKTVEAHGMKYIELIS